MRYISVLISIFLAIFFIIIFVIVKSLDLPGPSEFSKNIVIEKGDSAKEIAKKLFEHGIIKNEIIFNIAAYLEGGLRKLKAGEYMILPNLSPREVARLIISGEVITRLITIPEGLTSTQIVNIINDFPGLTGKINETPKEGSLFPDTYFYTLGDTRESLIERMTAAMDQISNEVWKKRSKENILQNINEMIILGSIVEKETGLDGERKIIAGVFVNRIKLGMRLQSDPTVIYGLFKKGLVKEGKLTKSDLKIESPWNTYIIKGLPPTAIANPGKESLEAAVGPAKTTAIYFVANGRGGHYFADNLETHNKNVKKWRSYLKCINEMDCNKNDY